MRLASDSHFIQIENFQLPSFPTAFRTRCLLTENFRAEFIYCLRTMDRIYTIAVYSLAELICLVVGITLGISRYYDGLRFHNIYEYTLSTKQFAGEFLAFVLTEALVGCLIGLCERQKFKPALTSVQPITGLLVSTLLIGLICEVCVIYPPTGSY